MKKHLLITWLLLLLSGAYIHAQTRELDSIRREINKHPGHDTTRLNLLVDYVLRAINVNTSQALPLMQEVVTISKELNNARGVQIGYIYLQLYYSDRGDFALSTLYADTAFHYLETDTSRFAKVNAAYLHNNLGGDNYKMGDYQKAIEHYTTAADLLETYRKPWPLSSVYDGLAAVYQELSQPEKAFEYDRKAISAAKESDDKELIGRRYLNYADRLISQKKNADAEVILKTAEPLIIGTKDVIAQALFYQIRGAIRQHKKQYRQAIADFRAAYQMSLDNDDKYQQVALLDPLIKSLMEAGEMSEAKKTNDTLLHKSIRYQMNFGRKKAYENSAQWYLLNNDFSNAYHFLEMKMALSDSISSDETKKRIAMTEVRYKMAGKDREIQSLRDEKEIQDIKSRQKNVLFMGSTVSLLIISLLVYRNYRHRQKIQQQRINELETEKQLTATEAILKGEEQERSRLAKDLHDGLGGMLSGIKFSLNRVKGNLVMSADNAQAFERSMDMLDTSIREMRRVAHNMMPEVLIQYGLDAALQEFCHEIDRSTVIQVNYQSIGANHTAIAQTTAVTIYRIVQELVGNTIKHSKAKHVLVQLHQSMQEKSIAVTVEDDGNGFDTGLLHRSEGMGWRNIRNRIEFLKGRFDIQSSPGKGTSVMIEMNS